MSRKPQQQQQQKQQQILLHKYGGTSLGSPERIAKAADRIQAARAGGIQVAVVVSAMGDSTDELVRLAEAVGGSGTGTLNASAANRELDVLLSSGEQASMALLAMALQARGCPARSFTGWQAGIRTNDVFNNARISEIDTKTVQSFMDTGGVPVIAGFQGISPCGAITTLGRGGSDTTAIAMAVALGANECQIYTDVDGVYTADPRILADARLLPEITLEEMLELASLGSKVLHARAVELASKNEVPLRVLSSFKSGTGTIVRKEAHKTEAPEIGGDMEQPLVTGVTYAQEEAKVTIQRVPDQPGIAARILSVVAKQNISIDMIVQNVSEHGLTDFTFTLERHNMDTAVTALRQALPQLKAKGVVGALNVAKVSVVGVGMRGHVGVAKTMFDALAEADINIQIITTSEIKISVLIDEKHMKQAVSTLHRAFKLEQYPEA